MRTQRRPHPPRPHELPAQIRAGFVAAFAALAVVALLSTALLPIQRHAQAWVEHTLAVLRGLQQINRSLDAAQTEVWAATFVHRPASAEVRVSLDDARDVISAVGKLTLDNPSQQARVAALAPALEHTSRVLLGGGDPRDMSSPAYVEEQARIRMLLGELRSEELRLLQTRQQRVQLVGVGLEIVIALGTAVLLALLAAALTATRREFRRREQLAQFRSRLAGIITHDLRSPLSAILATASLLERTQEAREQSLRRIVGSTRRIDRLLGLLSAFTSMHLAGDVELTREEISLATVARVALDQVGHGNSSAQLSLTVREEACGEWDRLLLTTAVATLVDGVLRRSPVGAPVEVTIAEEGPDALLHVQAPAALLPDPEREGLFEPLAVEPAEVDTISYSSGIGLYVARAILTAHGATLTLAAESAKGASVKVRLPRRADAASPVRAPVAAPLRPA